MDDALYRSALIVFHRELGLPLIEAGRFASAVVVWSAETPKARAAALEEHGTALRSTGTGRSEAEDYERAETKIFARRFGSSHAKPCRDANVATCARYECQFADSCQKTAIRAIPAQTAGGAE